MSETDDPAELRRLIREGNAARAELERREDDLYEQFAPVLGTEPNRRPSEPKGSPEDQSYRQWRERFG